MTEILGIVSGSIHPVALPYRRVELVDKKHFIAVHTCFTDEARRNFIDLSKGLTHAQMIEACKDEKAEMLAQWMGKDDFFYCHWFAESEEAIHGLLEELGVDQMCATSVNEMSRYVDANDRNSKLVGDPDNE